MIYRRVFNVPAYRGRSQFEEFENVRRQMDRLYGELSTRPLHTHRAGVFPLVNLTEDKDAYYIRSELPGIKADELDIQMTGNSISISGERKISAEDETAKYHRREREAGKFSRMMDLPFQIDAEKVEAGLVDGILTLVIPKAEHEKPRQVAVK